MPIYEFNLPLFNDGDFEVQQDAANPDVPCNDDDEPMDALDALQLFLESRKGEE